MGKHKLKECQAFNLLSDHTQFLESKEIFHEDLKKCPSCSFDGCSCCFGKQKNCEIPKVRCCNYLYGETPAAKESFHISETNSTENGLKHNKQAAVGRAVTPRGPPRGVSQPSFYQTSDAEFKAKTSSPIHYLNKTIKKNRSEVTHRADELHAAKR